MKKVEEQDWTWLSPEGTDEEHPLYCPHCKGLEICGYSTAQISKELKAQLKSKEYYVY